MLEVQEEACEAYGHLRDLVFEVVSVVPDPDASSPPGQGTHLHLAAPVAPHHSNHRTVVQSVHRNHAVASYAVAPVHHHERYHHHTSDGGVPTDNQHDPQHYHTSNRGVAADHPYRH